MKVILKDLGIQKDHDLSFITSEHAIQYVRELESSHSKSSSVQDKKLKERSLDFKQSLQSKNHEIADIMINFLKFNPFYRMTSFECLSNCRIFDSVRDPRKENLL